MQTLAERVFAALEEAGMPEVPGEFSVVPLYQEIPRTVLAEIGTFIHTFDRVTTRSIWQERVTSQAPEIARSKRSEVCFFSAWDFHLPPQDPYGWQLIEFNDNGSGLLFAGLINHVFYQLSDLGRCKAIEAPPDFSVLTERVAGLVEEEVRGFFGDFPQGLFLILDDDPSLQRGRFRQELSLLRNLFRGRGWQAEVASPLETRWDGRYLLWGGQKVFFVVNRSTDFFWQEEIFSPLRATYREGKVYVAPNPFTYATRSDKRLLEFFSLPYQDKELGIEPEERALLGAHVPETHLLREDNVEEIAGRKEEFFFKPIHGFAGHGLLTGPQVGRSRLQRLLHKGGKYVAQKRAAKSLLRAEGIGEPCLWTDLRVWAYRGEPFLLSGRASRRRDILDLTPPGGWLPTYVRV
jgi:hypothetical protein